MILQKFIKEINISSNYKDFVESFQTLLLNEFGEKIHSIYMCGSIPRGTAQPYKSDADFTILCENSSDLDGDTIDDIKAQLLERYPYITKIDTVICTLEDVRNKPNEWGFWVKIVCVNIYGLDVGEDVPPIHVSKEFILDLNSDLPKAINRVKQALISAGDTKMKSRYVKGYCKKLIRALFTFVLEDVGQWQDDIELMKKSIISYLDVNPTLVDDLYESYLDSDLAVEKFLKRADEAYAYIERYLNAMAAS